MGSREGVIKGHAARFGLSVEAYTARVDGGESRCFRCRSWHPTAAFSVDKSRRSGRTASCKACSSLASTASRYGMKVSELRALLVRSGGKCELCVREPDRLFVDHDHATGKIRGVLCSSCNVGMGLFGDDPVQLRKAADYLERSNG